MPYLGSQPENVLGSFGVIAASLCLCAFVRGYYDEGCGLVRAILGLPSVSFKEFST